MRIAIDASRTTVQHRTGTERYALDIIRAVLKLQTEHEFLLYFRDAPPDDLLPTGPRIRQNVIPWPRMWTHLRFAAALWQTRPDVTWVPAHSLPRFFPGKGVVTVHDLGYVYFPNLHTPRDYRYLDWSTRHSAHRAARIMADSQTTRQDLIEHYNIPADKIAVVYPGVDETLAPVTDARVLADVRRKYGLPERYLLFIGTLQPRKNIGRLVEAFKAWQSDSGETEIGLALAGRPGWLYDPKWTENSPNVAVLGYVEDTDITALYSGALAFLMPSLFEGFGFPILEAMRCDTPVICSNTTSLPELAGDAAILVDPMNTDDIAQGIHELVSQPERRADLVQKGRKQAAKFTWEAAARAALAVLENT